MPNSQIKELCRDNITEPLKIINIKLINGNYGIRVIPKCFYVYDKILESKVFSLMISRHFKCPKV